MKERTEIRIIGVIHLLNKQMLSELRQDWRVQGLVAPGVGLLEA